MAEQFVGLHVTVGNSRQKLQFAVDDQRYHNRLDSAADQSL